MATVKLRFRSNTAGGGEGSVFCFGGFLAYGHLLVGQLEAVGRVRTAEKYAVALRSLSRFLGGRDVVLEAVDDRLAMAYENHLRSLGLCPNTTSFYMRNLRAVYNHAVERRLTEQRQPFRHVYTGIAKTTHRAIPLSVVRRIRDIDLPTGSPMDYARDLFMFSFYTRGMSFVDMAFLRKSDLRGGILTYRRRKTRQLLAVKWERPMQDIVAKWGDASSPYLLPIIKAVGQDERRQYRSQIHFVNGKLKKIGSMLGLASPLTTYVARHGWASIAMSKHVPIATISEAMGHDSESTTRIYLASLDTSQVDKANNLILKAL